MDKKSIALSDTCSLEIIKKSIEELHILKKISPDVPHKIMASACSILHAKNLEKLYASEGMIPILIHSKMPSDEQNIKFNEIEQHKCNVVINVDMMGEGYDHRYLTIAALFRPYKSLNRFAQVIGRVLRAIPEDEITKHEIDNNAIVIYHNQLGLENLWNYFKKEVEDISKYKSIREIDIGEGDFERRETLYGEVSIFGESSEISDSYSGTIDFNLEFEKAKQDISEETEIKRKELKALGIDDEIIEETLESISRKKLRTKKQEFNHIYNEKRPLERRKIIKGILKEKIQSLANDLLEEYGIDSKGTNLYIKFKRSLPNYTSPITKNDGILVIFMNTKLKIQFSGRDLMEIDDLINAQDYLDKKLKKEMESILNGIK